MIVIIRKLVGTGDWGITEKLRDLTCVLNMSNIISIYGEDFLRLEKQKGRHNGRSHSTDATLCRPTVAIVLQDREDWKKDAVLGNIAQPKMMQAAQAVFR